MPLPMIIALAGALLGGALGAYGGLKLGGWLESTLSPEERDNVEAVCRKFGLDSATDLAGAVARLSPAEQKRFSEELDKIRRKHRGKKGGDSEIVPV